MKIDTDDYLTCEQVAEILGGAPKRAVYRAIKRCKAEGTDPTETIWGLMLVKRSALELVKSHYYPYYSDAHQANVRRWGALGGLTKAANAASQAGGRRRADASDSDDARA